VWPPRVRITSWRPSRRSALSRYASGTRAQGSRFLDRQEEADPSIAEGERAPALQPYLPTCDEPM
jgi:hypothetical protein